MIEPGGADGTTPPEASLRDRTISGARILAVRGFALKAAGAIGTLVLVRFLSPADFGVVAFGIAFVAFAQVFAEGGLAAALIRAPHRRRWSCRRCATFRCCSPGRSRRCAWSSAPSPAVRC